MGLAVPVALFLVLVCLPSDATSAARRGGGHAGGHRGGHNGGGRQAGNVQAVVLQQQALQARLNQIQFLQAQANLRAGKHHGGGHAHAHKGGGKNFTNIRTVATPTGILTQTKSKNTYKVAGARHHGKKPGKLVVKQNTVTVDNGLLGAATTTTTLSKLKGKHGGKLNVTQTTVDTGIFGTGLATVTALKTGKHGKHGKHGKLAVNQVAVNGFIPAPIVFADPVVIQAPGVPEIVAADPVLVNPLFAPAVDDQLIAAPAGVVDDEIDAVAALRGR